MKKRITKYTKYKKYITYWLDKKNHYIKESSYANYISIINNQILPEIGEKRLLFINNQTIQNLILKKYYQNLSDKTIKGITSIIKISLKDAMKNRIIKYVNLDFSYPDNDLDKKIYTFNLQEQKRIIFYCLKKPTNKNIGILLTLYTGLRIGEICALKWKDVDFRKNTITVNKTIQRINYKENIFGHSKIVITTPKTRNSNRIIPINNEFAKIIKAHKTNDESYILTGGKNYLEPRGLRNYFSRFTNKLRLSKLNFHSLRHTFATNCIAFGADYKTVSELLGHANVNITLNYYVHPGIYQKKKCINSLYKNLNSDSETKDS